MAFSEHLLGITIFEVECSLVVRTFCGIVLNHWLILAVFVFLILRFFAFGFSN